MVRRCLAASLLSLAWLPVCLAQAQAPPQEVRVHKAAVYLSRDAVDPVAVLAQPPVPGSVESDGDLEAVRMSQRFRTPEQVAWATFIDGAGVFHYAAEIGPWFSPERLPRCSALLDQVLDEAWSLTSIAKKRFDRPRPPLLDPGIQPCVHLPRSGSYPSGHAVQAYLGAAVLGDLLPERKEALLDRAHRAAWSRILAGVHYPTDDVAGYRLARAIHRALQASPAYQRELEACRRELDQARASLSKP
nr:phosphatase PAP2 family protein [uncultured Holophaga sp.]